MSTSPASDRVKEGYFKPLSLHLAVHCFPCCCTDPRVNSQHLCERSSGHREGKVAGRRPLTHEYFCAIMHRSIIGVCGVEIRHRDAAKKNFCSLLSLHLIAIQRMITLPWVNSDPQVTTLNIQAVALHNSPCQHSGEMTSEGG